MITKEHMSALIKRQEIQMENMRKCSSVTANKLADRAITSQKIQVGQISNQGVCIYDPSKGHTIIPPLSTKEDREEQALQRAREEEANYLPMKEIITEGEPYNPFME